MFKSLLRVNRRDQSTRTQVSHIPGKCPNHRVTGYSSGRRGINLFPRICPKVIFVLHEDKKRF